MAMWWDFYLHKFLKLSFADSITMIVLFEENHHNIVMFQEKHFQSIPAYLICMIAYHRFQVIMITKEI